MSQFIENGEKKLAGIINDTSNYFQTNKESYDVTVTRPAIGTEVYNHLEDCHYTTSESKPFVLTGTRGEQWVIDEAKLCKTYHLDGESLSSERLSQLTDVPLTISTKEGTANWAMRLPKDVSLGINTSWGEVLTANRDGIEHSDGDYIVCADKDGKPNLEDRWVVNGAVFDDTYNKSNESSVVSFSSQDFLAEARKSRVAQAARILDTDSMQVQSEQDGLQCE